MTKTLNRAIAFDTEFTGSGIISNQIVEIGAALVDLDEDKILDSFKIGPFHLDTGRTWEPNCREWWNSIPEMKSLAERIDLKRDTISIGDGMNEFVQRIYKWTLPYEEEKIKVNWMWVTDTVINDSAHLSAALDNYLKIRMSHFFNGEYRDAYFIDVAKAAAAKHLSIKESELKIMAKCIFVVYLIV